MPLTSGSCACARGRVDNNNIANSSKQSDTAITIKILSFMDFLKYDFQCAIDPIYIRERCLVKA